MVGEGMMFITISRHLRIVSAKSAEIARLNDEISKSADLLKQEKERARNEKWSKEWEKEEEIKAKAQAEYDFSKLRRELDDTKIKLESTLEAMRILSGMTAKGNG